MAACAVRLGHVDDATASAREALGLSHEIGAQYVTLASLQRLATVAAMRAVSGSPDNDADRARAAGLLGYVKTRFDALGVVPEPLEASDFEKTMGLLETTLRHDEIERLIGDGRRWSERRAFSEALAV